MLEPYLDADGCATEPVRPGLHRSRRAAPFRRRAGPRRIPGAFPRARRPGGPQRARRGRGGPAGERRGRRAAPPGAPSGRAPRRHPAVRGAGGDRQHPAAVGHPRAADGRADDPVPRRAAGGWQYPFGCAARGRRDAVRRAATGRSAARTRCRGVHVAVNRSLPASAGGRGQDPFLPEQAHQPAGGAGRLHLGQRPGERPGGRRPARSRPGLDADFAVVDADLAHLPAAEICQAAVRQTWVRGELAYRRAEPDAAAPLREAQPDPEEDT